MPSVSAGPPATTEAEAGSEAGTDAGAAACGIALKSLPRNILQDQQALFTQPFRLSERQWKLAVPLTVLTVGLVASDTAVEGHVTKTPSTVSRASTFSNAGLATLAGVGGGMYLWGTFAQNEHQRETGFLSGEAAIDAFLDNSLIQRVAGRERPFTGNGRGNFFSGGTSFSSNHSAVSWAIASVIAHEYPGPLTKVLSYGLAGAVSAARVEAHDHYLSDVVVGGALGWYVGRQVFRARSSDPEIDVHKWGTFVRSEESGGARATSEMGSAYVPLDSWVYEAFDRLAAMGYLPDASATMRPWTRLECARLLHEASAAYGEEEDRQPFAGQLLTALDGELGHETDLMEGGSNEGARVEELYARVTGISGTPLRDGFHFAQTLVDDYGRPYGQGANAIAGVSGRAEAGPLAFYLRGEYQYASALPAYNAAAQQQIALPVGGAPGLPYGLGDNFGTTSRLRPVEAYAALNISDWQLSFGQQSLWWGPDRSTSMILSNNAQSMPMLRLARVKPLTLPLLGPMHWDMFMARQGGIHYVELAPPPGPSPLTLPYASQSLNPPPYVWGISFSFKPTPNFELGFGHTTIFAGDGRPLNLKTFIHSLSLLGNGQAVDPGKRATEFNLTYRVPGLRKWLLLYTEGFAYDNPLEGKFVARYAFDPGIYLPQLPKMRKLDLRVEAVNTNLPKLKEQGYYYANYHYPQGYTNYGQIFGSWIGRQGTGGTASSTYWFTARNKITASYRKVVVDKSFLEGGHLEDFSGSVTWLVRPEIELSAMSQYEQWNFPLLAAGTRSDVSTSFELRFYPKARLGLDSGSR